MNKRRRDENNKFHNNTSPIMLLDKYMIYLFVKKVLLFVRLAYHTPFSSGIIKLLSPLMTFFKNL